MLRTSVWLAMFWASCSFVLAQQSIQQASPSSSADVLGSQLIVWSETQKPQPVAEPLPGPERTAQTQSEAALQNFDGTIVKDGDRYVLKVSDTVYQIDHQATVRPYEGKQVKIAGILDAKANFLLVAGIKLVS